MPLKGFIHSIIARASDIDGPLARDPRHPLFSLAKYRYRGFVDIVEGTVYALLVRIEQRGLVDVEKVPSEKGPPRKVYSLNPAGRAQLAEFWKTWSFLADRIERLHDDEGQGGD